MSVKKERRRSVILQCAVSGQSDVDIVWKKEGKNLETTEQRKTSRYSVEKKMSTQNQTIIQLEIMDADVEDKVREIFFISKLESKYKVNSL